MLVDQSVEVTGPGREEPFMQARARALAAAHGRATEPPGLRPAERRAAARGARQRLPRRGVHDERARRRPGRAHGARAHRARDRRALPLRPDDDRAERGARQPDAPLPALPGGRLVQRRGAAAHAVRARRLAVLLARGSAAGGTRPAVADRADPHHVGAEPAPPLHDRRGLRHGHRRARHARLGGPAPERPAATGCAPRCVLPASRTRSA